jgi:hypothetical protein
VAIRSSKFAKGFEFLPSIDEINKWTSALKSRIQALVDDSETVQVSHIHELSRELSNIINFRSYVIDIEQEDEMDIEDYDEDVLSMEEAADNSFFLEYDAMKSQIYHLIQETNIRAGSLLQETATKAECDRITSDIAAIRQSAKVDPVALGEEFKKATSPQHAAIFRKRELDMAIAALERLGSAILMLKTATNTDVSGRSFAFVDEVETLFHSSKADIEACMKLVYENAPRLRGF